MSKEKKQELKEYQKRRYEKQKSLRIMDKIVFNNDLIAYALFSSILLNPYI